MIGNRRSVLFVVLMAVMVAGVIMALVGGADEPMTSAGTLGTGDAGQPVVGQTGAESPLPIAGLAIDPAKQEPVLDRFVSKDPFMPLDGTPGTPTPTPTITPTPAPTSSPTASPTPTTTPQAPRSAVIRVSGRAFTVEEGDETPPDNPVFLIADISASGVTFQLLDGMQFEDGSSSVQVANAQSVTVTNADTNITYQLEVVDVRYADSGDLSGDDNGGGNGAASTAGHSIQLLSINTRNGQSSATFKVDGSTYADKEQAEVFSTRWGQIKVLGISAAGQSSTILHGDDTLVLHVGQRIEK